MRLIDADAIQIPNTSVDMFENCRNCNLLDADQVREIIENAPTIEPKHGEWIETPNHTIRCSVCGAEFTDDIMDACLTLRLKHPRACSVCTARMKGADDE